MRSEEKDCHLPGVSDLRQKNKEVTQSKLVNLSSTSSSSNSKFNQRLQKDKSLDTQNWSRRPVVITSKLPKAFSRQTKSISSKSSNGGMSTHRGANPGNVQELWYKDKGVSSSSSALSDQFESSRDEFAGCQGIPSSNIKMYSHNQWNMHNQQIPFYNMAFEQDKN